MERHHRRLIGAGTEGKGSESFACLAPEVAEKRAYGGTQKPYCNENKFWSEEVQFTEGHKPTYGRRISNDEKGHFSPET